MRAVEEEEAVAPLPAAMADKQFAAVAPMFAPNRSSSGSSFAEVTVENGR